MEEQRKMKPLQKKDFGKTSKGKVITRKPILPSEEEMAANSRSKSAKLRIFERGSL